MEAAISKLINIGWIVGSLFVGILSFYLFSNQPKTEKKKQIEEITSQLINLVLFIWLSKILLQLPLFVSDPFAVLAYPSNSHAFYLAIALTIALLWVQVKRKKLKLFPLVEPFIHIFLISSFVYEFIQGMIYDNPYSFGPLALLAFVVILFFILQDRMMVIPFLYLIITAWASGMFVLALSQPFVTVFGYIISPWFIVVFYIGSIFSLGFQQVKLNSEMKE